VIEFALTGSLVAAGLCLGLQQTPSDDVAFISIAQPFVALAVLGIGVSYARRRVVLHLACHGATLRFPNRLKETHGDTGLLGNGGDRTLNRRSVPTPNH